jgi:integrase
LEWRDINLDAARLRIERSQVEGQVGPPKTEVTRRDVYLSPAVVEALREHRRWQVLNQVAGLSKGLVFPSNVGGYRNPALFRKPLARCCKLAGIDKHISSHCLRKTANNLLRQHNSSDVVVRAMIGHATSEMTRLYSNVGEEEKARAHANAFGDVFNIAVGLNGGNTGGTIESGDVKNSDPNDLSKASVGQPVGDHVVAKMGA